MKFQQLALLCLPGTLAFPAASDGSRLVQRQSAVTITDNLLFSTTLPIFTSRRNARDPPTLDWTSDGCTSSPDNPFGFPFVPACNRHDFGYNNYRIQTRFTQSAKLRIDDNFKADLYFQCASVTLTGVCEGLADVYYAFVRAFGGDDATAGRRSEDLVKIYEEKVATYEKLVEEAQKNGDLPVLE